MITMAMLLLVSDWLVIAGNYGIGGGGGHLQERRLTDSPGLPDPLAEMGMGGGNKSTSNPGQVGEMGPKDLRTRFSPDIAHEWAHQESYPLPENPDKLVPIQSRSRVGDVTLDGNQRNITLTQVLLKPLFRVHLDTTVKRAPWAVASTGANHAISSEKRVTGVDSYYYRDKATKSDKGFFVDNGNYRRVNHSTRDNQNSSQPFTTNLPTALRRGRTGSPTDSPFQVIINVPTPKQRTPQPMRTSSPLRHQRRQCDAFEKRCDNGMCVSHIVPCPQKACPVRRPFRCQNKWQCISLFKRCDGDSDCEDGSDEKGCDRLSYPYSHNRRIVVVATIIVVVVGISLFCCVLIHVYRSAQNSNPVRRAAVNALHSDDISEAHNSATWSALAHLRRLLPPHLRSLEQNPSFRAGPSASFQSTSSSVTQPFLSPHNNPACHTQSETLQSFLSATDSVVEVAETAAANPEDPTPDYHWTMETAGPPPPYEEVVSLGDLGEPPDVSSLTRRGLHQERDPPPTYESIFCIEV